MIKDLSVSVIADFYGDLLTPKQRQAIDLYYNRDCSLSEIAETMGVSRQGARDFIKKGEQSLNEFEQKLGLAKRFLKVSGIVSELEKISDKITQGSIKAEISDKLEQIKAEL